VSVYSQNGFGCKEVSVWSNKFKDGQTALNYDTEKQRGRPKTSHTDENCVIVGGLIRENGEVIVHESHCKKKKKTAMHAFTFLGKAN
jgi:hypothetical protein